MIHGLVRMVMAAVVLLAGIHCGCASCFDMPDGAVAFSEAGGMAEMACCQREGAKHAPADDSAPKHSMPVGHAMACVTGDSSVPAVTKTLMPALQFVAMPVELATFTPAATPFLPVEDLTCTAPFRDGATLLRLHCALTV